MSNSLDPDQARQNVGPDLGPNCLQRLSADHTICCGGQTVNGYDYQIDKEKLFTLILNSESVRVTLDELTEGKDYFWRSM